MEKPLLISILIASVVIPARCAHANSPMAALRKSIKQFLLFEAFYLFGLLYIYPRIAS